jgi:hypothetical protein
MSCSICATPYRLYLMTKSIFGSSKIFLWAMLALIFGAGLAVRLYDLTDPPLDFHGTRQLHSAIKARGMYYKMADPVDTPEWKRDVALELSAAEETIEPPILEWLAAVTYTLAGGEYLWIPRLYSIFFWMLGGVLLFLLTREIAGTDGAIISLVYFMVIPFGIYASRSFQPDPLMTISIVAALWGATRWQRTPTWRWTILAGLLAGFAIFTKLPAIFFIAPAFIGVVLTRWGLKKALRDVRVWTLAGLSVLPYLLYYIYAQYIAGFLDQGAYRFFPDLWTEPAFYIRWTEMINGQVSLEWALLALIGVFLLRQKGDRGLMAGAWAGYIIYGMTLPYHTITHDYYQLPLIPLVAIGLASSAQVVIDNLQATRRWMIPLVTSILIFSISLNVWTARVKLIEVEYKSEASFWSSLGETIGPDVSATGLTHDYGFRLAYWGWVPSSNWMTSGDFALRELAGQEFDMEVLFDEAVEGKDIFIVTLINELNSQPALKNLLYENYPADEQPGYILFDLQKPHP